MDSTFDYNKIFIKTNGKSVIEIDYESIIIMIESLNREGKIRVYDFLKKDLY